MKRDRLRFLVAAALAGALCVSLSFAFFRSAPAGAAPTKTTAPAAVAAAPELPPTPEALARQAALRRMADERATRARLAAKSEELRHEILLQREFAWERLIARHQPQFRARVKEAQAKQLDAIECTICGGSGMFATCHVCADHRLGACQACDGRGQSFHRDRCPVCQGSGHCFFCNGRGTMPCPFCDSGMIILGKSGYFRFTPREGER